VTNFRVGSRPVTYTVLSFFRCLRPFSVAKLFRRAESEQEIRRDDGSVITEMVRFRG